jgi:hypothetical protein
MVDGRAVNTGDVPPGVGLEKRMRALLGILGIVGIVLAALYFTMPADQLPLPGILGHDPGLHAVHMKHGAAALVVGLVCLFLAWRQSAS